MALSKNSFENTLFMGCGSLAREADDVPSLCGHPDVLGRDMMQMMSSKGNIWKLVGSPYLVSSSFRRNFKDVTEFVLDATC